MWHILLRNRGLCHFMPTKSSQALHESMSPLPLLAKYFQCEFQRRFTFLYCENSGFNICVTSSTKKWEVHDIVSELSEFILVFMCVFLLLFWKVLYHKTHKATPPLPHQGWNSNSPTERQPPVSVLTSLCLFFQGVKKKTKQHPVSTETMFGLV